MPESEQTKGGEAGDKARHGGEGTADRPRWPL